MLEFVGSQRVRRALATEQQQETLVLSFFLSASIAFPLLGQCHAYERFAPWGVDLHLSWSWC